MTSIIIAERERENVIDQNATSTSHATTQGRLSPSKCILAQTAEGHVLLDPYTTLLGNGIPAPFKIIVGSAKGPPRVPYDGLKAPNADNVDVIESEEGPSKRRKLSAKKKCHTDVRQLSANEQANLDLHEELKEWMPEAIQRVRETYLASPSSPEAWYSSSRLCTCSEEATASTSVSPQDLVAWGREARELQEMESNRTSGPQQMTAIYPSGQKSKRSMLSLFDGVYLNEGIGMHRLVTPAATYLVPPRSGFLMADMKNWYTLLHPLVRTQHFNVVLLDPPWRSKSVRRSGNYEEMDMYDLYKIRLPELLGESAKLGPVLVGVWVTNHPKCRRFARDKLLPSWQVTGVVDWYWIKITSGLPGEEAVTGGLPVWSFDGPSPRRCYEGLMLGYYNPNQLKVQHPLPDKRIFLSVPLEHSRKPLVTDLLRQHVQGKSMKVLELFSRYTPPGPESRVSAKSDYGRPHGRESWNEDEAFWFSVGNESLKYNDLGAFWKEEPEEA